MRSVIASAVAAATLLAIPAAAQSRPGAVVSGSAGVFSMEGQTSVAVSGSISYKLNSALSFGVELTSVPEIEADPLWAVRRLTPSPLPASTGVPASISIFAIDDAESSLTTFTTNVRVDIPTTSRRILPFVTGGGGVANVEERFVVALPRLPTPIFADLPALGLSPVPPFAPDPYPVTTSSTGMALTLGGGASILATDHLSIDVDLRYFRILGEVDRDAGRFGAGVSYRF